MPATARLAWRNLGRNRRRTVVTAIALAIGTSLSVAAYGITDGMMAAFLDALTGFDLGHVQIHHPDYPRRRNMHDTVPDGLAVLDRVRGIGSVKAASPRVYGYALVSHGDKSLGAELVGVDPAVEPSVTTLHEQITAGRYLETEPTPWPEGRALTAAEKQRDEQLTDAAEAAAIAEIEGLAGDEPGPDDTPGGLEETQDLARIQSPPPARPPRVIVGSSLAKILRVEVGGRMHAIGQASDGTSAEVDLEVVGIYHTGTVRFDRTRVYLHIADLQRFTRLAGKLHEISIVTDKPADAPALADDIRAAVGSDDVLVRDWEQIRPDIKQMLELSDMSMAVMIFIILFVAALGVVNTMLMSVFERTRELGVLKAIGMPGRNIVALILSETLVLVLVASAIGTGLGLLLDWHMVANGVDLQSITGGFSIGGVGLNPVFHGEITLMGVLLPVCLLAITSVLASLYPAVRAARMRPAVGMRET